MTEQQKANQRRVIVGLAICLLVIGIIASVWREYWIGAVAFIAAAVAALLAWFPEWKAAMSVAGSRGSDAQNGNATSHADRDARESKNLILIATAIGAAALLVYAVSQPAPATTASTCCQTTALRLCLKLIGSMYLEAGAGFAFGALMGFLFGIPRRLQGKATDPPPASTGAEGKAGDSAASTGKPEASYASNTNLEEISDWLTKIIVGLGLINLKQIPDKLKAVAAYFAVLADVKLPESISMSTLIYFSVCGFFFAYLLTRLALPAAFSRADRAAILDRDEVKQLAKTSAEQYLDPRWDAMQAKDRLAAIAKSQGGFKVANELLLERLIPSLDESSRKYPTLRSLHIILANSYAYFHDLKAATDVLERFLDSLKKEGREVSQDAADALYNLACYYTEEAQPDYHTKKGKPEKDADTAAKQASLRKAAEYMKNCLTIAKRVGRDIYDAEIRLAAEDEDLKLLRESKELLKEFGISDIADGTTTG